MPVRDQRDGASFVEGTDARERVVFGAWVEGCGLRCASASRLAEDTTALHRLGSRLDAAAAPEDLMAAAARTVGEALRLRYVAVQALYVLPQVTTISSYK